MASKNKKYYYCTLEDVKNLTGVKPSHYGFKKDEKGSDKKLEKIVNKWIELASSTINDYCKIKGYEKEKVPETIRLVCMMMVSNIIAYSQARKDTPIIKVNDWKIDFLKLDILNDELKEMLDPFKEVESNSSCVDFFAITGD
jgi:hypothetical protein